MGIPNKNAEHVAITGTILSGLCGLLMLLVAGEGNSIAARVEAFHLMIGFLIWGMTYLHLRARRLAAEERLAIEETEHSLAEKGRERLFEGDALSGAMAQSRLRELEKYGVPVVSVIVIALQLIIGGLFLYALAFLGSVPSIAQMLGIKTDAMLASAVLCSFLSVTMAFATFALGVYAAGMAQDPALRLLRAGAGYILGNALCLLLITVVFGLGYLQWTVGEVIVRWVVTLLILAVGIEMLINFVLDFYRPRSPGDEMRPVYDSRLAGIMAEPQGLFRTFAQTMDYQFGFSISDTWFFRFLERAIAPLLIFQILVFYLLTCIVVVRPGEVAVLERWGRPIGVTALPTLSDDAAWDALEKPLEPGLCVKWPWPIDTARRIKRDLVREIYLGSPQKSQGEILREQQATARSNDASQRLVSWDTEHIKDEFKYVMPLRKSAASSATVAAEAVSSIRAYASGAGVDTLKTELSKMAPDSMFVSGRIKVQYVVGRGDGNDPRRVGDVYRYLYRYDDPHKLMISICEREVTSYLAGSDFWALINENIDGAERELTRRIQQSADDVGMGVQIVFVGVSDMHPPVGEVGKAYQQVVAAHEERRTAVNRALGMDIETRGRVPGQSDELLNGAKAYWIARTTLSRAEAERFNKQRAAYEAAPEVYRERAKLATIEEALRGVRIVIKPQSIVTVIDDKQSLTAASIGKTLAAESAKE